MTPEEYAAVLDAAWADARAPRAPDAPTVVSLFAGGGGSSLGYAMAGYRELLAVEFDPHAVATLRANLPEVPVHAGDITKLTGDEVLRLTDLAPGELDLLDGSPPCQGFSVVGKRDSNDARNGLFHEYVRLLAALRPRAFVIENVPGLVIGKMRRTFDEMARALAGAGYRCAFQVLDAQYFGVPQMRRRMIGIGVRADLGIEPAHPSAQSRPIPLCDVLASFQIRPWSSTSMITDLPKVSGASVWGKVPIGGDVGDVMGSGFSHKKMSPSRPARTLTKQAQDSIHPYECRCLSIDEAKVIQSFPAAFALDGTYRKQWARIGNSVPPLLMRAVARHVLGLIRPVP